MTMTNKFFEEEIETEKAPEHFIWVEKYRPLTLNDYLCDSTTKVDFQKYIETQNIPHLLFHGGAGTGKTSIAKILASGVKSDVLCINASEENSVDTIRTKIKDFASSMSFAGLKIIILDEAEYISMEGQAALRNLIETYSLTTRFIITCNTLEKLMNPLVSRCQVYEVYCPSKKDIAIKLTSILVAEKVKFKPTDIVTLVNNYYPDIRKVINAAQKHSSTGELVTTNIQNDTQNIVDNILKHIKSNKSDSFNLIRQVLADGNLKHYEHIYKGLFDNVDNFAGGHASDVICILAEYSYQSSFVVDKEITLMACISKILTLLKQNE